MHSDGAAYAHVNKLAPIAETIDSGGAHVQPRGDSPNRPERLRYKDGLTG